MLVATNCADSIRALVAMNQCLNEFWSWWRSFYMVQNVIDFVISDRVIGDPGHSCPAPNYAGAKRCNLGTFVVQQLGCCIRIGPHMAATVRRQVLFFVFPH